MRKYSGETDIEQRDKSTLQRREERGEESVTVVLVVSAGGLARGVFSGG